MVTRGQLLERPVVIPMGELCLDGIYLRGDAPGLLVAAPTPGRGGSMVSPVCSELSYAAAYSGAASLRVDYRGVGGSEGESTDGVIARTLVNGGVDLVYLQPEQLKLDDAFLQLTKGIVH